MKQERLSRRKTTTDETAVEDGNTDVTNAELAESTEDVLDSIDDILEDQVDLELLADLDGVLGDETEARAQVDAFVQQGGE